MDDTRYRAINYKGKREYVWDPKGSWVRKNNEFVKCDKTNDNNDLILIKELKELLKLNPYLKNRVKGIKNVSKQIYYAKVWLLTEANDLTILDNHKKRGFRSYHLDHIYPISEGFKNNIPVEAISNIKNLQFIHHRKNIKKGNDINDNAVKIIEEIMKKI